jgi:cysteine desulfurase
LEQFKSRAEWPLCKGAYVNTKAAPSFKEFVISRAMTTRIYLDANAGAPLLPGAREAVVAALADCGNASSVHAAGRKARARLEEARAEVAGAVGAEPENVVFTSGATEAAAYALTPEIHAGDAVRRASRLYVGATEHPCVLAGGRFRAEAVSRLPVQADGTLDLEALHRALAQHDYGEGAPYLALMLANNESGVIHPVTEAARVVKEHGGYVFCDAVQAIGRIPVEIAELGVDFLAISSHKIGGPQGAGALVLADAATRPAPLLTGGGQERRRRAGTENVAASAGFAVAAGCARHHLERADRIRTLRDRLEEELSAISPDATIVGHSAARLPNTTLFTAPGLAAELAVIALDLEGVAVSAGSACSSGKVAESHVLAAMGRPGETGVRVSLTADTHDGEVDAFLAAWRTVRARLGRRRAA